MEYVFSESLNCSMGRRNDKKAVIDPDKNNHTKFFDEDPPDIEIRPTAFAGKGLFANRRFEKGEFIVNYRASVVLSSISEDNIYAFDTGKPHHLVIDASDYPNAHGRHINDIDPSCNKNCHPEKFFHEDTALKLFNYRKMMMQIMWKTALKLFITDK